MGGINRILENDFLRAVLSVAAFIGSWWLSEQSSLIDVNGVSSISGFNLVFASLIGMSTWTMTTTFALTRTSARTEIAVRSLGDDVNGDIAATKRVSALYEKVHAFSRKDDIVCDVAMFAVDYAFNQVDPEVGTSGVRMRGHTISLASYREFWERVLVKLDADPRRSRVLAATTHSSSIAIWRRPEYGLLIERQKRFAASRGIVLRVFIDRPNMGSPNDVEEYVSVMKEMAGRNVACVYIDTDQIQPEELPVLEEDLCLIDRGNLSAVWSNATDGSVGEFVVSGDEAVYNNYRHGPWSTLVRIVERYDYDALIAKRGVAVPGLVEHKIFFEKSRKTFMTKLAKVADDNAYHPIGN